MNGSSTQGYCSSHTTDVRPCFHRMKQTHSPPKRIRLVDHESKDGRTILPAKQGNARCARASQIDCNTARDPKAKLGKTIRIANSTVDSASICISTTKEYFLPLIVLLSPQLRPSSDNSLQIARARDPPPFRARRTPALALPEKLQSVPS